jgi:hypothetical protein
MKTFLACLTAVLLAGCATVPSGPERLVGDWRYSDSLQSCLYSFRQDGTFTGEVRVQSKLVSKFHGRWSIKGHTLLYQYLGDVMGRIPTGATDQDELLELGSDSFVIRAANGDRRRYIRRS